MCRRRASTFRSTVAGLGRPAVTAYVGGELPADPAATPSPRTHAVADVRTAILRADDARVTTAAQRKVIDDALAHAVPDVRVAALRAIGRTQRAEFLPKAIAELSNPSIDVRREAAFAVAHIGSGEPVGVRAGRAGAARRAGP